MGAAGDLAGNVAIVTGAASASPFLGRACLTHYAASNATIVNLTKSPALKLMSVRMRINAVAPGGISTAITASSSVPDGVSGVTCPCAARPGPRS